MNDGFFYAAQEKVFCRTAQIILLRISAFFPQRHNCFSPASPLLLPNTKIHGSHLTFFSYFQAHKNNVS